MRRRPATATLYPEVAVTIADCAVSTGAETGGLLLGWWDGEHIVARHAVEVVDPEASRSSWTREEGRAQHALEQALAAFDHPWLGYVGDWHTHLLDRGPSRQDVRSIRHASRCYDKPLLLLVQRAHHRLDARAAQRGRTRTITLRAPTHESGTT
jgi:integrative and conjugative element protein (TIGR02256 family)